MCVRHKKCWALILCLLFIFSLGWKIESFAEELTEADVNPNLLINRNMVWQLGTPDKSAKEFLSYKAAEFARNDYLLNNSSFDSVNRIFTYSIIRKIDPHPRMPAGLSSKFNFVFSPTTLNKIVINWKGGDDEKGILKIGLAKVNARRQIQWHIKKAHTDSGDIRISLPDGKVVYRMLDESREWKVPVQMQKGDNTIGIELKKYHYGYSFFFDYLSLEAADKPENISPILPVIEVSGQELANLFSYESKKTSYLTINLYNLNNKKTYFLNYKIVDFFGEIIRKEKKPVSLITKGQSRINVLINTTKKGYFELLTELLDENDKVCKLNMKNQIKTQYAVIKYEPINKKPNSPFGIHALVTPSFLAVSYDTKRDLESIQIVRICGMKWNRILPICWYGLSPSKGVYKWEYYDEVVNCMHRQGISILGNIYTMLPEWACTSKEESRNNLGGWPLKLFGPPKLDDYYDYVYTLVKRYKGKIDYWEVGNEVANWPLSIYFYGNSSDYVKMLKTAYRAAKAANPKCTILLGGLIYGQVSGGFLDEVLTMGGKDDFDILSIHYSGESEILGFKSIMARRGISKPIINTEERVAEAAADLVKGFIFSMALNLEKVFYFTLESFLTENRTPRPALIAYRVMTEQLEDAKYFGKLQLAKDIFAYEFIKDRNPILVLFNNKDIQEKVMLYVGNKSKSIRVIDLMGNEKNIMAKNGYVEVICSQCPIYITGLDKDIVEFLANSSVSPQEAFVVCGDTVELKVKIKNTFIKPLIGEVKIEIPENWSQDKDLYMIDLKPGEEFDKTLKITVPNDTGHKKKEIVVAFSLSCNENEIDFIKTVNIYSLITPIGENVLKNKGFEEAMGLKGWQTSTNGNCAISVANKEKKYGKKCLWFATEDKNALAIIKQTIEVLPGEGYKASLWGKSNNSDGHISFRIQEFGKEENKIVRERNFLQVSLNNKENWNQSMGAYKVPDGIKKVKLMIILAPGSNKREDIFVDDVKFALISTTGQHMMKSKIKYGALCSRSTKEINIDGDISEFKKDSSPLISDTYIRLGVLPANNLKGKDDLSGQVYLMWDEKYLYLATEVIDDKFIINDTLKQPGGEWKSYKFDSLQIAIDPDNKGKSDNYIGFTLAQTESGPQVLRRHFINTPEIPATMKLGLLKEARLIVKRKNNRTIYEAAIPIIDLYPLKLKTGGKFGFSYLINDNDGSGRCGYLEWSSGIGAEKDPSKYGEVTCQ